MALSTAVFRPGDTLVVHQGTYPVTSTITITRNGLDTARYYLLASPGSRPLLDCSAQALGSRGINLKGSFWTIRGIDVKGSGDNGMYVNGSNNIIDFCSFFENRDTGLQLGGGAANNRVINCDSYCNVDPGQGNADGFAPKLDVGTGNAFFGCRSWQNSDDGWDGYLRGANDVTTTLENCWCFANGYLKNGSASVGNGNGYKMGGSDTKDLMHNAILKRCLAVDNRVKGFDQNNNRGSMTLLHCTGYGNGKNYSVSDSLAYAHGKVLTVINCAALGSYGSLSMNAVQQTNSWMPPLGTVTSSDFLSIDTAGLRAPRKADGSLPDITCLVPAPGSLLIDAGTDIGLPFLGKAPDLGAFEASPSVSAPEDPGQGAINARTAGPGEGLCVGAYPNPFNMLTVLSCTLPARGALKVSIYDVRGRMVRTLDRIVAGPGLYRARWDGRDDREVPLASGLYLLRVRFDTPFGEARAVTARLLLVK